MSNKSVIQWWWVDQISAYFELLFSLIVFTIMAKKMHHNSLIQGWLKFWIYSVFTTCILASIAMVSTQIILPIFTQLSPSTNQTKICRINYCFPPVFGGLLEMSIINLFMEKLHISFENSALQLSKTIYYGFRIVFNMIWVGLVIAYFLFMDPDPYNIYTQQVDYTGNGITCSTHAKTQSSGMKISLHITAFFIFASNASIWLVFMRKLCQLVKHTANLCDRRTDCDRETRAFKELMKEQTLLVSIATLSTLLLWTLQAIIGGGSYFIKIDVVITVFSVFLTFKFNRSCFQWFQCDKMTVCCCDCIEQYPQWSTGDGKSHQLEMTQALSNNSQRTKRHNSVPTENVDELNALVFVD
eukprot:243525_1